MHVTRIECRDRLLVLGLVAFWLCWPFLVPDLRSPSPGASVLTSTPTSRSVARLQALFDHAKSSHDAKYAAQSRTLAAAQNEYVRRYGMRPPKGFEKWYGYAISKHSPLIDDYDLMMNNIRPFRAWFGNRQDLLQEPGPHNFTTEAGAEANLLEVCIRDHGLLLNQTARHADTLQSFLSEYLQWLPDLCFDINPYDEPRSNISWANRQSMISSDTFELGQGQNGTEHAFMSARRRNIWPEIRATCPSTGSVYQSIKTPEDAIRVAGQGRRSSDLCARAEAPTHGSILSPNTMFLSRTNRPILSVGSFSSFSDILFPTLWRYRFYDDKEAIDTTPWAKKLKLAYWRGSTTSGRAMQPGDWKRYHRQRLVRLANESRTTQTAEIALEWNLESLDPEKKLPALVDAKFTKLTLCEEEVCELVSNDFAIAPYVPMSETFKHRIVLDTDGTGLSGRLYYLLRSNSLVMKQGLVTEWHDDYLSPWLHYVPLSMEMVELKVLLDALLSEEGRYLAEAIAEQGRVWANAALRREDMKVFMFRLLLELGRRDYEHSKDTT